MTLQDFTQRHEPLNAQESTMIRVIIADDLQQVRDALIAGFAEYQQVSIVGETSHGHELITLCHQNQPDVVVLDPQILGADSFHIVHQLYEICPALTMLMINKPAITALDDWSAFAEVITIVRSVLALQNSD